MKRRNSSVGASPTDFGPTLDPFMYGWQKGVGYKQRNGDKYVSSGSFNTATEELDLKVEGGETVKINMSGATSGGDGHVTSGSSTINESEQKITLEIGDGSTVKSTVDISLSGMSQTYSSKEEVATQVGVVNTKVENVEEKVNEINKRLIWGEF